MAATCSTGLRERDLADGTDEFAVPCGLQSKPHRGVRLATKAQL
jgi:hypothetical protein